MLEFYLFKDGIAFYPFQAGSWEAADAVARLKGWEIDDHMVGSADEKLIVVRAPAPLFA
jgi:hypothetical protein